MGVEYRLDILTTAGVKVAEVGGEGTNPLLEIGVAKQVNTAGRMTVVMSANNPAVALLGDKYLLHLYRRWPEQGISWYVFFYGLFRTPQWDTTDDGRDLFTMICPGQLSILDWRQNLYAAGTSNKTTWSSKPAETIMKNLVTNNLTSSGTTGAGRDRNATNAGTVNGFTITVEADSARGTSLSYSSQRGNVLKELQDVAAAAGTGDFDLVKTGAATWEFRYYPLLGTDRSTTVTFSKEFGNIRRPRLIIDRESERTAIVVGGGGQGTRRAVVTRTGTNYAAGTNDIETFVNGATTTNGTTSTGTLNSIGDKEATKRRARGVVSYDIVQDGPFLLDRDYALGDKVKASVFGQTLTQQVYSVAMSWKAGNIEDLRVGVREYGA